MLCATQRVQPPLPPLLNQATLAMMLLRAGLPRTPSLLSLHPIVSFAAWSRPGRLALGRNAGRSGFVKAPRVSVVDVGPSSPGAASTPAGQSAQKPSAGAAAPPATSFASLGLCQELVDALSELNITVPTEVQVRASAPQQQQQQWVSASATSHGRPCGPTRRPALCTPPRGFANTTSHVGNEHRHGAFQLCLEEETMCWPLTPALARRWPTCSQL